MKKLIAATALVFCTGSVQAAELTLTAEVDTTYCASNGTQCSVAGSGHTAAAAGATNHNPVRLFVNVSRAGAAVSGLTIAGFVFNNNLVPASASAATVCTEAKCGTSRFQGGVGGTYSIFLDRGSAGNWRSGVYSGSIRVTSGADSGVTLVTFRIP